MRLFLLFHACVIAKQALSVEIKDFQAKLIEAKLITDEIITKIGEKWRIKEYPNFLKSVAMSHTGWEVLKVSVINKPNIYLYKFSYVVLFS